MSKEPNIFNRENYHTPDIGLEVSLKRIAQSEIRGSNLNLPPLFGRTFDVLLRIQRIVRTAARIIPTHHKSIWGKWKKRRKLSLRDRKKEKNYGPVQKPRREDGDAAYRYDEWEDV